MYKVRNIIFDFDGTLADTAPLIIATMQAAIRELDLPLRTNEECRASIGLRLEYIPAALWPGLPDLSARYAAAYRRIFDEMKHQLHVTLFPGVSETLRCLKADGINMAIASSRSHGSLVEYVGGFDMSGYFGMLIGGNDVEKGKPAPDPVIKILNTLGWNAADTLVVGDAAVDILMGRSAGTVTCGVTYGNGTRRALAEAGADFIIDRFVDITGCLGK